MSQKNISALIGLLLLAALATWVVFNNVSYTIPQGVDGTVIDTLEQPPWWSSLLFWQGDQERSIRVHYGLDLVGGSQVVLQGDLSELQARETPEDEEEEQRTAFGQQGLGQIDSESVMEAARVVIENRVSGGLGVVEPLVQLGSNNRIIVELPEVDDPDQAISLLRETGRLEFVEILRFPVREGDRLLTSLELEQLSPDLSEEDLSPESLGSFDLTTLSLADQYTYPDQIFPTIMTGAHLEDAEVGLDQAGGRAVNFTLTEAGRDIFATYTSAHVGDILAITLDGVVVSAPIIQNAITTREGQITGGGPTGFEPEEAESTAIKLKYGALPIPLDVVENRTIGPTLGQESIQRSIRAGSIGLIVVLVFMLVYYRVPGFIACLTLALYAVLNFALYKLIPVTLTVPAITGFILSIGMAVDANILVFERLKEELRAGRSMRNAVEAGFNRAWPSIRDGNLSTLITCYILFVFGTSFGATIVRGFAVTLAIGVAVNLFTAVPATRILMRLAVGLSGNQLKEKGPLLLGLSMPRPGIQMPERVRNAFLFVQKRRWYYIFSALIILPGLIAMGISIAQNGSPLKLSIDYTGGTLWEMHFEEEVQPLDVRQVFVDAGLVSTSAQRLGEGNVLVRTSDLDLEEKAQLESALQAEIGQFEERRFESVGPTIGREVTRASGVAVAAASIAILLFIWYVFRAVPNAYRYGFGAVIAMLHDVLITAGVFSILGLILNWEVTALFLTAILTVIGYSVNDTIVVFDRLRENLPRYRSDNFETVSNRSLLETLNRSLATSISTLFVVGSILAFGGATTQQFIAVMLIGIVSGTYSSIFTAVPFLVSWQKGDFSKLAGRSATIEAASG